MAEVNNVVSATLLDVVGVARRELHENEMNIPSLGIKGGGTSSYRTPQQLHAANIVSKSVRLSHRPHSYFHYKRCRDFTLPALHHHATTYKKHEN